MLGMVARYTQNQIGAKRVVRVEDPVLWQCIKRSSEWRVIATSEFAENRLGNRDVLGKLHDRCDALNA